MKSLRPLLISLLLPAFMTGAAATAAGNAAAIAEITKLQKAGVGDDVIVAYIQSHPAAYDLSADKILELHQQGLSSAVLNAMLAGGRPANPATPAVPAIPAIPATPAVPATPATPAAPAIPAAPAVPALPATPATPAAPVVPVLNLATEPDVAYFYQELTPYGRWILVEDGRWSWQPAVVSRSPAWRPYSDRGQWIWTDHGWYWRSEYSWGWAPFHYGRWQLHPHHGWVWFPDRVWGPAWVVWRAGDEHCGWAPLPPGAMYDTVGGHLLFRGHAVEVGFDFGLGPSHFTFCLVNELGRPSWHRLHGGPEMHGVFQRTVILGRGDHHAPGPGAGPGRDGPGRFFNHGIEPSRVAAAGGRRPEEVHIRDLGSPAPGRGHEKFDSRRHTMEVYRPHFEGGGGGGGGHR